ncbi:MAG: Na+/H+ antiporter NhaC [Sporomusaceae bacterium]|nr:Na+/H+ antiporter NhaC [Sporomusaceae bacterium]
MKRRPTFLEAIFPIGVMLFFMFFGTLYHLKVVPLIILSAAFAGFMALRIGLTWEEMQSGIVEKLSKGMPAVLILLSVGIVIGSWIISGTVPMMIYYGLQTLSPDYLYVAAFFITTVCSLLIGTSWGTLGTVGISIMGIAAALEVNMAITAGAVVSGTFLGDKISPLSDSVNLAALSSDTPLYEHIKHLFYTTIPVIVIVIAAYTIMGLTTEHPTTMAANNVNKMLDSLNAIFSWNLLLLLPPLIVIYGAVTEKPALPCLLASSFVAALIAKYVQGFSFQSICNVVMTGFKISMVKDKGIAVEQITPGVSKLISQGGLIDIFSVLMILFSAFAFAGIISKAGCLEVIGERILTKAKSDGSLVATTVFTSVTTLMVMGSIYLAIIIPGEIFKDSYKKHHLHSKNLSRALQESSSVVAPLIPWSETGAYTAATLGMATAEFLPWAFVSYLGAVLTLVFAFTGFSMSRSDH